MNGLFHGNFLQELLKHDGTRRIHSHPLIYCLGSGVALVDIQTESTDIFGLGLSFEMGIDSLKNSLLAVAWLNINIL